MKHVTKIAILTFVILLATLMTTSRASAQSTVGDKVVFGDTYRLGPNETLDGNLTILGGAVTLAENSLVKGNIALMGGALEINGTVDGNVSILGGSLSLGDTAMVRGNVTSMGGTLHQSEKAQVNGQIINGRLNPFSFIFPQGVTRPNILSNVFQPIGSFLGYIANALLMAALAMLVVMFLPKPTERVAQAVISQPAVTGGLGLLSIVVIPVLVILFTITLIFIPVALLVVLVTAAAIIFGWIALGFEVGKRMAAAFKFHWHDALVAGLGTLVLTLIVNGIGKFPCIGWVAPFLVCIFSLGAVILTRFGRTSYPLSSAAPINVTPLPPTVPPAAPINDTTLPPVVPPLADIPLPGGQTSSQEENTPSQ